MVPSIALEMSTRRRIWEVPGKVKDRIVERRNERSIMSVAVVVVRRLDGKGRWGLLMASMSLSNS